ncbi:hypothetical protein EG329_012879, partial [Mollisiaceae sp. DMI_Dod_QoI]
MSILSQTAFSIPYPERLNSPDISDITCAANTAVQLTSAKFQNLARTRKRANSQILPLPPPPTSPIPLSNAYP